MYQVVACIENNRFEIENINRNIESRVIKIYNGNKEQNEGCEFVGFDV
jgi:hypothetical protein